MDENNKSSEPVDPEGPKPLFSDEELKNLRAIKLISGEDILAIVYSSSNPEAILTKRPCKVIRIVNENGSGNIILLKWHVFSNQELIPIMKHSLISFSKVTDSMKDFYIESVVKQISEELEESSKAYKWPDWLDEVIQNQDKSKIN
jgi:hypothetical protein